MNDRFDDFFNVAIPMSALIIMWMGTISFVILIYKATMMGACQKQKSPSKGAVKVTKVMLFTGQ